MDKTKAVVWFTGVISKYNLSNDSLDDLKINYSLLEKLSSKYDLIFIICVPNEDVKLKYLSIIKDLGLSEYQYLFIPYQHEFLEIFDSLISKIPNITTYVDYSKARMIKVSNFLNNENIIHISQLID